MLVANINFDEIPEIGFALQRYSLDYKVKYGNSKKCIEIAYISSGEVKIKFEEKELLATEGSVIVLFRHLPIATETVGDKLKSHYTVLAEFTDYGFSFADKNHITDGSLTIPFITEPCRECEEIGKRIQKIASAKATESENILSLSIEFLSILNQIHLIHKKNKSKSIPFENIANNVCSYIEENISKSISLPEIAEHISKSPNHISHAFKSARGITISEYINIQKINRIKSLIQHESKSFKEAVEAVGLCDLSYGYRLFKRWTGITPKEYMQITTIKK